MEHNIQQSLFFDIETTGLSADISAITVIGCCDMDGNVTQWFWAKELGKQGVRVVGVAPGIMEATGLRTIAYESALAYTRGITVDDLRAGYSKTSTIPLGRSGKLSEVADMCVYLASQRASYVHGVTVNVAGGKTRG